MTRRASSVRSHWIVIASVVLVGGVLASFAAANQVAHERTHDEKQHFSLAAAEATSRLRLDLEREDDLIVSAGAQFADDPRAAAAGFARWATSVQALARYPEVAGLGAVFAVPAAALPAYAAQFPGGLVITPPGRRDVYCLVAAGVGRGTDTGGNPGFDFCAGPVGARLFSSRDTGIGAYDTLTFGDHTTLVVQTPLYAGGLVPATLAARRAAFVGWLGVAVDTEQLLAAAREDHPHLAVTLARADATPPVAFTSGVPEENGQVLVSDLGSGWTVRTVGKPLPGGVLSTGSSRAALAAGIAISLLVFVLLLVLTTGRMRALRLVAAKTDELRHQALHDSLTGLPNRALLLDRVDQALHRARRADAPLAVMFLDLDGFKSVNDTYGHAAGDQLLNAVGARLRGALRETDTIGRIGGDEFVVLAEEASLVAGPELVAERLQAVLVEPFAIEAAGGARVSTRASIGIAVGIRSSADDLLRDADVALYEAKAKGKGCFVVFAPEMQVAVQDRLLLEMDLRDAIDADQFALVYQPILDLTTETVIGVEALLRWNHPVKGVVMPNDFIPAAEETGLIVPIGRWVLEEACRQTAAWHARGFRHLTVAVNVSGRQLDVQADLVSDVRHALASSGLSPDSLILEITETMLMRDVLHSERQLRQLKTLGVRVAIDDFGTGYCSLAYLQRFPVDALKIDRSFVSGISRSPEADALIHTFVQLGKSLGIQTYAEGIEVRDQLRHLQDEECDSGQGYLFARPMSADAFEALVDMPEVLPPTRVTYVEMPVLS